MGRRQVISPRLLAAVLAALVGAPLALAANNPPPFDPRTATGEAAPPAGGLGGDPEAAAAVEAARSANPLWGIPLATLTATQDRPIFLPSRRRPAPAVAAPRIEPVKPPVAIPAEPERPPLSLVGIVAGIDDGYAVFIHSAPRDTVRLRTGEGHEGWILTSVKGREAVLEKNRQTSVMALPPPAGDQR
jgi:general secretion pathway protein N